MCIPYPDCPVPGTGEDLVPMIQLAVLTRGEEQDSLIELNAINTVFVSFEVYRSSVTIRPSGIKLSACFPNLLPILARRSLAQAGPCPARLGRLKRSSLGYSAVFSSKDISPDKMRTGRAVPSMRDQLAVHQ